MNTIKSIVRWFELAKPNPTKRDTMTQIGCHFEEVIEMMDSLHISGDLSCYAMDSEATIGTMNNLANYFKSGGTNELEVVDKKAMADALGDQIVTAIGVGVRMGFDMEAIINEINRSNYSKFENGQPIFDENGKIKKGKFYTPPNLEPFIASGGDKYEPR